MSNTHDTFNPQIDATRAEARETSSAKGDDGWPPNRSIERALLMMDPLGWPSSGASPSDGRFVGRLEDLIRHASIDLKDILAEYLHRADMPNDNFDSWVQRSLAEAARGCYGDPDNVAALHASRVDVSGEVFDRPSTTQSRVGPRWIRP